MRQATVLAIIGARAGSKRLPNKNIHPIAGKPLIAYSIEAALQARLLDRTVVSTEDRRIAKIARQYGAETPFLRPAELATDETVLYQVIAHTLEWLQENEAYRPEYVALLQATSPLRTSEDIDNCIRLALEKDADAVVSLCETNQHPYLAKKVTEDGRVFDFGHQDREYNRMQDMPPAYAINGSVFVGKRELLLEHQTWYTDRTYAYLMPDERSLDIDTMWDIRLAELMLNGEKTP